MGTSYIGCPHKGIRPDFKMEIRMEATRFPREPNPMVAKIPAR